MFMIPESPHDSATLKEWSDYRLVLLMLPEDEPGMSAALAEANAMIAAIKDEQCELLAA
ncbi:MAG: hypothetical protein WC091_03610 [Sulfuricellaceae bacterium]